MIHVGTEEEEFIHEGHEGRPKVEFIRRFTQMHLAMTQMGKERSREGAKNAKSVRRPVVVIHLRDLRAFA